MNTYMSQQIHLIYIQSELDTPIPREDDNTSENFESYEDNKFTLEEQDIQKNHKTLVKVQILKVIQEIAY